MRKTMVALCVGLGIVASTLTSGTAAAASDARADDVRPLLWAHAGWFKTVQDCVYVGEEGRAIGRWRAFECDYYWTEPVPWELYADYI